MMGSPMARHLARGRPPVTVFNRTPAKATAWSAEYGGRVAATPADAALGADLSSACVGNDDDLREITLGQDGAFGAMAPARSSSTTRRRPPCSRARSTPPRASAGSASSTRRSRAGSRGREKGILT